MLKKLALLPALFLFAFNLAAQQWDEMKLAVEIGVLDLAEEGSFGLFLNVEPKLRSSKNTSIGLRIGITANSLTYENFDSTQFTINEESGNGVVSFVPTFDYHWPNNKFRPSLGIGLGSYLLVSFLDITPVSLNPSAEDVIEVNVNYRIGLLLRGGFKLGRSRIGLEYNFVPKSDIELPSGQKVGIVDRSYLGLSVGFTIGVWKK